MGVFSHVTVARLQKQYRDGSLSVKAAMKETVQRAADSVSKIWSIKPDMIFIQDRIEKLDPTGLNDKMTYPLWGVPFAVDESIDIKNMQTFASDEGKAYYAEKTAPVILRLVKAGAVPVGKTTLQEKALDGSYAGGAIGVAMGVVPLAVTTGAPGTGVTPAAQRGLFGFSPALGLWSEKGIASIDGDGLPQRCFQLISNKQTAIETANAVLRRPGKNSDAAEIDPGPFEPPARILLPAEDPVFEGIFADSQEAAWKCCVDKLQKVAESVGTAVERATDVAITPEMLDGAVYAEPTGLISRPELCALTILGYRAEGEMPMGLTLSGRVDQHNAIFAFSKAYVTWK